MSARKSLTPYIKPVLLAVLLGAAACSAPGIQVAKPVFEMNLNAVLSEDEGATDRLRGSLTAFLTEYQSGEFTELTVAPVDLLRHSFYFSGLAAPPIKPGTILNQPSVLKSYSLDGETYFVTISFTGERSGEPSVYRILELKASPYQNRYRFSSPFDDNAAALQKRTIGEVTFHYRTRFNQESAEEFATFREWLRKQLSLPSEPLDYYCFQSLDDLLRTHGILYDAAKCNSLGRDLGFADEEGRRFVTGTGRESYKFGYIPEVLESVESHDEALYWPFVCGLSAYYGGYGPSGDDVTELARQFREKLEQEPGVDFLKEFERGRGSSVHRHFSFYVICTFLCREAIEQHGFQAALNLARSGRDGESFFANLQSTLGITRSNFHATICRLIEAPA